MTTNLGSLFRAAEASSGVWDQEDVQQALEVLAGSELQIDWEPGDEEWGRVIDAGGNVHALVCARVPVGIGLADVEAARLAKHVSWMTVPSMSEPVFEVDRQLLEQVFGRSLSENIDYSKLSINDLWWATVS